MLCSERIFNFMGKGFLLCIPPFNLIPRALQKVYFDQSEGLLTVPRWPNQPWYSMLTKMLVNDPLIFPPSKHLLHLPSQPDTPHPLHRHLQIMACHITRKSKNCLAYHLKQSASCLVHLQKELLSNTVPLLTSGSPTVPNKMKTHSMHLSPLELNF